MTDLLWAVATSLLLLAFVCLLRAGAGPTLQDRLLAVNMVGTKATLVLAVLALATGHGFVLDVALVYALLNVVLTLAATRFLERGAFKRDTEPASKAGVRPESPT